MKNLHYKKKGMLIQFCKAPIPGKVKTRLTPFLSNERACEIHKHLAFYIFRNLISSFSFETTSTDVNFSTENSNDRLFLTYQLCVDQKHHFFENWLIPGNHKITLQKGHSLGDRLKFAAKEALEQVDFVIFIGSDCPFISNKDIHEVKELLYEDNDLVIIPADDGGYVLIAIKKLCNTLFENIHWGSEQVLKQTLSAAKAIGLRYYLLDSKPDIDRPEDLMLLESLNDFPHTM